MARFCMILIILESTGMLSLERPSGLDASSPQTHNRYYHYGHAVLQNQVQGLVMTAPDGDLPFQLLLEKAILPTKYSLPIPSIIQLVTPLLRSLAILTTVTTQVNSNGMISFQ